MRARLAAALSLVGATVLLLGVPAGAGDDPDVALPDGFELNFDPDPTPAIPFPDLTTPPDQTIPDGFEFNFDSDPQPGDPFPAIPFPDLTTPPDQTIPDGFDFNFDPDPTPAIPFPDLTTPPPDQTIPDGFQFDFDPDPQPDDPTTAPAIPFPEIGEPASEVVGDQTDDGIPPLAPLPADWAPADLQADSPPADQAPAEPSPGIPFPELHTPAAAPAPAAPPASPTRASEPAGPITIGTIAASISDAIDAIELPVVLLGGAAAWVVLLALVLAALNSREAMHSITDVKEGAFVPAYHRPGGADTKTMAFAFRHNSVKLWQAGPGRRKRTRRWLPLQSPVGRVWVDRSLTRPAHRAAAPIVPAVSGPDEPGPEPETGCGPDDPGPGRPDGVEAAEETPLGAG